MSTHVHIHLKDAGSDVDATVSSILKKIANQVDRIPPPHSNNRDEAAEAIELLNNVVRMAQSAIQACKSIK